MQWFLFHLKEYQSQRTAQFSVKSFHFKLSEGDVAAATKMTCLTLSLTDSPKVQNYISAVVRIL